MSMSVGDMSPQEIHEYNGVMVRTAKNGALQDIATGRMVAPPPVENRSITAETASMYAHQRWHGAAQDAYRRKVQEGLAGRGDDTLIETIEQARGEMIGVLVEEVVLNPDVRGIDRVKAHEHALEQSGMDGRAPKQVQNSPANGIQINIGADVAAQMMAQLMQQAQNRGILDAE